jgi:hypothetical protein
MTIAVSVAIIMILLTLKSALAFSIDADDEFDLIRGETIEGSFVIEEFRNDMRIKSNLEWVSLDENKYVSEKTATGQKILDNTFVVPYWISVPDDADVGIYRGVIEVDDGDEVQYLNIKISVQNRFVTAITKAFNKTIPRVMIMIGGFLILLLILFMSYRGVFNAKK